MLGFVLGVGVGAVGMYFGSEKVHAHVHQTALDLEAIEKSKRHIQELAQKQIVDWTHEGTLLENLKLYQQRTQVEYNSLIPPQMWEDARVLQASYVAK